MLFRRKRREAEPVPEPEPVVPTEAMLFLTRELFASSKGELTRLLRTCPPWLDVFVVGFDPERAGSHQDELLDGRIITHRLYGWDDVRALDLPVKMTMSDGTLAFVPGNMDWLFFCFDAEHPGYERIWWTEDDVRFRSRWRFILRTLHERPEGMIAPQPRHREDDPDWAWWYTVDFPEDVEQVYTFHPFGRLSRAALDVVRQAYADGWKGHHEVFLPSAVKHAGLGLYDPVDFYTEESFRYRPYHEQPLPEGPLLWHPVRGPHERRRRWTTMKGQRISWREDNGLPPSSPIARTPEQLAEYLAEEREQQLEQLADPELVEPEHADREPAEREQPR